MFCETAHFWFRGFTLKPGGAARRFALQLPVVHWLTKKLLVRPTDQSCNVLLLFQNVENQREGDVLHTQQQLQKLQASATCCKFPSCQYYYPFLAKTIRNDVTKNKDAPFNLMINDAFQILFTIKREVTCLRAVGGSTTNCVLQIPILLFGTI